MNVDAKFNNMNSLLSFTSVTGRILRKAGFWKAERVVTGTRRDGNRTVNLYSWKEGYLISIDEGEVKITHMIEYPWTNRAQEKISQMHRKYLAVLLKSKIECFINGREEIVIAGKRETEEASEIESGEIWKHIN